MSRHPTYTGWPTVEGYCGRQSVLPGESVNVHCSSRSARISAEVVLVGGGNYRFGPRSDNREQRNPFTMWRRVGIEARERPVPERAWADGCDWPVTFTVPTQRLWPSGLYLVRLTALDDDPLDPDGTEPDRLVGEAFFVIRQPDPASGHPLRLDVDDPPILLVLSTNTWNAYNQWGGRCLYSGADRVSFARPIERGYLNRRTVEDPVSGATFDGRVTNIAEPSDPEHRALTDYQRRWSYPLWTASAGWHNWERRFVHWAEAEGYRIDIATDRDLEDHPEILDGRRLMVSVGHDEYWSSGMRNTVDRWVRGGGNWAVFSGNTCFWQVRHEGETMICHKGRARIDDPLHRSDPARMTSMWSDPRVGRPETSTTGLTFTRGGYHRIGHAVADGTGDYEIHRPDHWAFDGTGLAEGDRLGTGSFIVGYEVDGCALEPGPDGRPVPTGEDGAPESLEVLATAPARLISITDGPDGRVCEAPEALWASVDPPGDLEGTAMILFGDASAENVARIANGHAVMGCFSPGPDAGTVFNAGTADWAYGLDADPVVRSVTANVIRRLNGDRS